MTSGEIPEYRQFAIDDAIARLKRDPFGRRVISVYSEHRGAAHDYFRDPELVMKAAKLLQDAASPGEQQEILRKIDIDLRIINSRIMRRHLPDVCAALNGFMALVNQVMRQNGCIPMRVDIQSASQKTHKALGRIIELSRPKK